MSQKKTSGTTPASPQQEAQRASLFVAFIGGALIGAAFLWTVFELELLPGQDDMAMPGMASGGVSHSMQAETLIATDDWPSPPTLDIAIQPDPVGGWNLNLKTTNFTFDAAAAGRDNAEGYGHAHVYVNGMKLGRVYGDWYISAACRWGATRCQYRFMPMTIAVCPPAAARLPVPSP